VLASPVAPPKHSALAAAQFVPAPRPWWPWLLVAGGLFVACLYGARAYAAYQVVQRVEASTAARVTQGIGNLLAILRLPNVAAPFDPRNGPVYAQAMQEVAQGAIVAGAGVGVAVFGLVILALWQPGYVPHGAARPATLPPAVDGGLALLGVVAGIYLGSHGAGLDLPPVAREQSPPAAEQAAVPSSPGAASAVVVQGQAAPVGQRPVPTATATPAAVFYRGAPYGPVKIEPGQVQPVRLPLGQNTLLRATLTITFNNRLSNISGVPDLDIAVIDPQGTTIAAYTQVRNGFQLSFQASVAGDYTLLLSNTRSRVNAKQVGVQFLQP
jgi:hypothetical protein